MSPALTLPAGGYDGVPEGMQRPDAGRDRRDAPSPGREDTGLEALLARVALGDRAAFRALYERTCRCLLGVAHAVLRDPGLAEDVLQDVYLKVWQRAGSYEAATASPMTWLINVARNRAIDVLRARRAERAGTLADGEAALAGVADADDGPDVRLEARRAQAQLMQGLEGIPAAQRQALALAYFQGLTHGEIATTLRVPLGTAKARVRRGLDALRQRV